MPIFVAFAAFLFVLYAQRQGMTLPSWLTQGGLRSTKSAGQKSGVRTTYFEMVLDHDSGSMDGTCLKGRFAGKTLSSLGRDQLLSLLQEVNEADAQSSILLEAYLDRQWPEWRDARPKEKSRTRPKGKLDPAEAYDVLGLKPGATREEVRAAHRRLMMKMHPDLGGSAYLASRINEARDTLLRAH